MLRDNFYTIVDLESNTNAIHAIIELNEKHPIFKGHFPGQPVVPGVCEMQIVKEILSSVLQKEIRLQKADDIKFLQMIDPALNTTLNVEIDYFINEEQNVDVRSVIYQDNEICFKLNGVFVFNE